MRIASPLKATTIGSRNYVIDKDAMVVANFWAIHRDTSVWGEDVSLLWLSDSMLVVVFTSYL